MKNICVIKKIRSGLMLFVIIGIFMPAMGMGQEPSPVKMKAKIKEVQIQNTGTVLRKEGDEIVIDDRLFHLSKYVSYHAVKGSGVVTKNITPGTKVCFNMNDKGEIVDIWILSK